MIEIIQRIPVYEVDGEDVPVGERVKLIVKSHWNRSELVVLKLGGETYTVKALDLTTAIGNAQRTGG